jgi:hypothetical protein
MRSGRYGVNVVFLKYENLATNFVLIHLFSYYKFFQYKINLCFSKLKKNKYNY